jgi:two-component system sensor histidine kinase YesM
MVILGLVLFGLIAISAAFYQSNQSFLSEYIQEINLRQIESIARLLDSVFYRASYASAAITGRPTITGYLSEPSPDQNRTDDLEKSAQDLISLFVRANAEINSIYVYAERSGRVVTDRLSADIAQFHDKGWVDSLARADATRPVLVFREDPVFATPMISVLRSVNAGDRYVGGVVVNLDVDALRRLIGRGGTPSGEGVVVVQENDKVVFSTTNGNLGEPFAGTDLANDVEDSRRATRSAFVVHAPGEMFNLDYYAKSGSALYEEKTRRLRRFLILLLVAIVSVGTGISVVLARFTYRPIREIVDTLEHPDRHLDAVATAADSRRADSYPADEVKYIEDSVIRIMASNQRLERRLSERFHSLRRAHYAALQLQINPHFLYNTLESIYWNSVEAFDPEDTVPRTVSSLSRFLRMILATDTIAVPLAEEVEITTQYATLLQLRFHDLLKLRWAIAPSLSSLQVPKLILQPLVENGFYHGIKPLRRPGTITVGANDAADMTELWVSDDGCGMSDHRLQEVHASLADEIDLRQDHIGLLNVAQRLRILYGTAASVRVDSVEGDGTTVTIRIPRRPPSAKLDTIVPRM